MPSPASLADLLPDEPRYVDLRGLLLSGRCDVHAGGDPRRGFIARSRDFPFAAVYGRPEREVVRRAVERADAAGTAWAGEGSEGEWHLLVQPEGVEAVAVALPGWGRRGVTIHRYAGPWPPPPAAPPAVAELLLAPDGSAGAGLDLGHVPQPLRHELGLDYVASRPLAAALVDGRAVAFCYAPFVTPGLWDVAVDTLEPYRRRGLAAACFRTLAAHLAEAGKRPVWGALDSNTASLRLAAGLGFVLDTRLTSIYRRSAP